jgi:DNA-binding NarL/FixJ family response regulator
MSYLHEQHTLLVDDYPFIRLLLRHILESGGYRVIAEASCCGDQAIDHYLRYRPAVTVVDISGQRQNGLAVIHAIFAHDAAATIILSAFDAAEAAELAEAVGARGVLVKPYSAAAVLAVMQAVRTGGWVAAAAGIGSERINGDP